MPRCTPVILSLSLCLLMLRAEVYAQNSTSKSDSLRAYDLAEIVVSDGEARDVSVSTIQKVSLAGLARQDAASIDQVIRLIPAAHIQTNSRGESLIYLRNAGERQVGLFFDGALLNIPWDNRVDLSFIPSSVIGGMTVAKGVPSVLYGTNVLGGAVNMTSRALDGEGRHTEVLGSVGSAGLWRGQVTHLGQQGAFSYIGAIGYMGRNGHALPGEADLPFTQRDEDLRTNTDQALFNVFARGSYRLRRGGEAGVSVLHIRGEKGVAPESHLDPAVERVRFWRYPEWQNTMVVANAQVPLAPTTRLRGAVWASRFAQAIDQFTSVAYQARSDRQDDEDYTLGSRLTLFQDVADSELRFALNALTSRHDQQETAFAENGGATVSPSLSYRQHLLSLGGEYEGRPTRRFQYILGASLDAMTTPETGDKPSLDAFTAVGLTSGVVYLLDPAWTFKASAGRKVRFPTMRELFGAALNTFLINPDLKPETSLLVDIGLVLASERLSGEAVVFMNRTYDTIDQQRVTVDGARLRQRINLDGSRVLGVELVGMAQPARNWTIEGHLTHTDARGFEEDGSTRELTEKPDWVGTVSTVYNAPQGLSVMVEATYLGRAFALAEDNTLVALPTALRFNARLAYRLFFPRRAIFVEAFTRVDNLTDDLALPQLGLPAAGREVRGGLNISF